jgi:hypothetical protein
MKSSIRLTGAARVANRIRKLAEELERSQESLLKQEARAACVSFGFHTQPYGFQPRPPAFIARVTGDIRRVYANRDSIYAITELVKPRSMSLALGFYRASKAGKTAQANKYLRQAGIPIEMVDRKLHRGVRQADGSVPKGQRPLAVVRMPSLTKYIREKIESIGTAKAGWYAAAKALGGRVRSNTVAPDGSRSTAEIFPAYIRKLLKTGNLGGARVSPTKVEVFTHVKHARLALDDGSYAAAISASEESFRKAMQQSLAALIKKHLPNKAA